MKTKRIKFLVDVCNSPGYYHRIYHFTNDMKHFSLRLSLFNKYKLLFVVANIRLDVVVVVVCSFWLRWFSIVLHRMLNDTKRTCDIWLLVYSVSWFPKASAIPKLIVYFDTFLLCISWIKEDTWVQSSEYLYFEFVNICCINSQFFFVLLIFSSFLLSFI